MMETQVIWAIFCTFLIGMGLIFFILSVPYITNKYHKRVTINRVYFTDKIPAYIYVKMESNDGIIAGNPIDISVTTTNIDRNKVRGIQLTFEGADRYFPDYTKLSPPSSREQLEEYFKKLEKELDKLRKEIGANILVFHNDTDRAWTSFSGSIKNVIYSSGGKFDIGLTIIRADGGVIGYEMGQREYAIKGAIEVSPPEVLFQIENSNIMRGLGLIGIGLPFFMAGITLLIDIIKHYLPL
jgi:hypothetical protein